MRSVLRGAITFTAALLVIALLLALNNRLRLLGEGIAGLALAIVIIGSAVKLWRVAHGDLSVTSDAFWFPKWLRSWLNLDLRDRPQPPHRQEPPDSN